MRCFVLPRRPHRYLDDNLIADSGLVSGFLDAVTGSSLGTLALNRNKLARVPTAVLSLTPNLEGVVWPMLRHDETSRGGACAALTHVAPPLLCPWLFCCYSSLCESCRYLYLSNNTFTVLDPRTFQSVPNLLGLSLSYCKVNEVWLVTCSVLLLVACCLSLAAG